MIYYLQKYIHHYKYKFMGKKIIHDYAYEILNNSKSVRLEAPNLYTGECPTVEYGFHIEKEKDENGNTIYDSDGHIVVDFCEGDTYRIVNESGDIKTFGYKAFNDNIPIGTEHHKEYNDDGTIKSEYDVNVYGRGYFLKFDDEFGFVCIQSSTNVNDLGNISINFTIKEEAGWYNYTDSAGEKHSVPVIPVCWFQWYYNGDWGGFTEHGNGIDLIVSTAQIISYSSYVVELSENITDTEEEKEL